MREQKECEIMKQKRRLDRLVIKNNCDNNKLDT